jgi:hypothetical protein
VPLKKSLPYVGRERFYAIYSSMIPGKFTHFGVTIYIKYFKSITYNIFDHIPCKPVILPRANASKISGYRVNIDYPIQR